MLKVVFAHNWMHVFIKSLILAYDHVSYPLEFLQNKWQTLWEHLSNYYSNNNNNNNSNNNKKDNNHNHSNIKGRNQLHSKQAANLFPKQMNQMKMADSSSSPNHWYIIYLFSCLCKASPLLPVVIYTVLPLCWFLKPNTKWIKLQM